MLIEEQNPTNRELIIKAIDLDLWSYCKFIGNSYVNWCHAVADKLHLDYIELVSNPKIERYYLKQYQLLVENLFVVDCKDYLLDNIKAKDIYTDFLNEYAENLKNYYPASLVKEKPKNTFKITKHLTINLN